MTTENSPPTLGARLRERLAESGKTQSWLANEAEISRSKVNRILNDRITPSADELRQLLKALGVGDPHFMDGAFLMPSDLEVKELDEMRQALHRAEAKFEALQDELSALKEHYEAALVEQAKEADDRARESMARVHQELAATREMADIAHGELSRLQEQQAIERQGYEEAIAKRDNDLAAHAREKTQQALTIIQLASQVREKDALIKKLENDNSTLKGALAMGAAGVGFFTLVGFLKSREA